MCCVKIPYIAVTVDQNPWWDIWHPMLPPYGVFTVLLTCRLQGNQGRWTTMYVCMYVFY